MLWTAILNIVLPLIEQLIKSAIIPRIKRLAYQHIDNDTTNMIEDLIKLKVKISKEEDPIKKANHEHGFELGLQTLDLVADKITKATSKLRSNDIGINK